MVSLLIEGPTGAQPTKANLDKWITGNKLPFTTVIVEPGADPNLIDHYGAQKDHFLIYDLQTMKLDVVASFNETVVGDFR